MAAALTDAQLWSVVTGAGWSGQDALTAFAVALAESGGRPDAYNGSNNNGSADHGLFQINTVHKDLLASGNWRDAATNARMGKTVFDRAGGSFTPWVAYKTGAYMAFMARAQRASANGGTPVPSTAAAASGTTPDKESDTAASIANVTAGNTWIRISYFVVGALLILIFAVSIIKNTGIVNAIPIGRIAKAAKAIK